VTSQARTPTVASHIHADVGRELQAVLVDLVDLSLLGKQLHWSVVGPLFRSLHEQLDELVDCWRELADSVAERAVAIGFWPDGQAGAVVATRGHASVDSGAIEECVVVRTLSERLAEAAAQARAGMDRLGELDPASQDVLTAVVRALEEQLWMVRAQLPLGQDR
jgi:starvation-inducible DNA-binding protein